VTPQLRKLDAAAARAQALDPTGFESNANVKLLGRPVGADSWSGAQRPEPRRIPAGQHLGAGVSPLAAGNRALTTILARAT